MKSSSSSSPTRDSASSSTSLSRKSLPQNEQIDSSRSNVRTNSQFKPKKSKRRKSNKKLPKQESGTSTGRHWHLQRNLIAALFMVIFVISAVFAILQLRVRSNQDDSASDQNGVQNNPTPAPPYIADCHAANSNSTNAVPFSSLQPQLLFVETNVVMPKSTSVIGALSLLSTVMASEMENLIARDIAEHGCYGPQAKNSNRDSQGIRSINVIPSNHSETGACVLHDDKSCHKIDFTVELLLDTYINVNKYLLIRTLDETLDGNAIYKRLVDLDLAVDMVQILSVTEIQRTSPPTKAPTTPIDDMIGNTTSTPTQIPSKSPSSAPSETVITYVPGKLTVRSNGLLLSEGLACRILAKTGQPVALTGLASANETVPVSNNVFHIEPDGAGVFEVIIADHDGIHRHLVEGGWVYISNSENENRGEGGVGGLYFNAEGEVVEYRRLLDGTTDNCSGGKTPWGTWVSCEERDGGRVYQVDPMGIRPPQIVSAIDDGWFEAFAYDIRNPSQPRFFVTEDHPEGALRRFTPTNANWEDPWQLLHSEGTLDYLMLEPYSTSSPNAGGTFSWTSKLSKAQKNADEYYQYTEGIDVYDGELFVVSKLQKQLFILDLDAQTYQVHSTISGVFDGMPDQLKRVVHGDGDDQYTLLYFTEELGAENGVHARDENGWFFSILESDVTLDDEATGLAFSPDGKHMYLSYQKTGMLYDIWREDGLPFHGKTLNVHYHSVENGRPRR